MNTIGRKFKSTISFSFTHLDALILIKASFTVQFLFYLLKKVVNYLIFFKQYFRLLFFSKKYLSQPYSSKFGGQINY